MVGPPDDCLRRGHIYFNSSSTWSLVSFEPPEHGSRKKHQLKTHDGHDVVIQLISNDYLTLRLNRELLSKDIYTQDGLAPEVFEFAGVCFDHKQRTLADESGATWTRIIDHVGQHPPSLDKRRTISETDHHPS